VKQEYQSILQNGIEKRYLALEEEIEKDIVRRIQKAGKITSAADWQIQRYMVLGHSTEDVEAIIRQAVGGDWADTFRLYDEVIEQEYVRSRAIYEQVNAYFVPYEQNYELQQITNALIRQSNDELFNISKSLGFMVDMGGGRRVFTPLSEIYNGYLDNAITMMASGAFDYSTLIRRVVGEMTASGLRTVDYASGHSNRVDVAVRRSLLTGMSQLTGQISRMNGQALGTDKYEVDWHPGARPDHAKWQGRVWTYQQLIDVCGLDSGPGLLGWNCHHSYYPFLDGISVRNYSDEWLEEMDRKEAQRIPYRGREYNTYEATQKQRQMETGMRAQREKAQLLKQGSADPDDILNARCKYQAMLDEYKEFSRKFNLPEQRERIYADLRGRVAPSQRTYKKWQAEQADKAAKRAVEKEREIDHAMREKAEKNRREDMEAAKGDKFISGIREFILQNPDAGIEKLGRQILDSLELSHVEDHLKAMKEWGYCRLYAKDGIMHIMDYNLNSQDGRKRCYRIKTAFHEAFHAKADGMKTDFGVLPNGAWLDVEETFAESAAHYLAAQMGITDLAPSYGARLCEMLPRLKRIPEFSSCTNIADFGKVAFNGRMNGAGAEWTGLYNRVVGISHDWKAYSKQYFPEISANTDDYIDKMLENMPNCRQYKEQMKAELDAAMDKINSGDSGTLTRNENLVMSNVVSIAMNRLGVK
jgi:hypothetical protein